MVRRLPGPGHWAAQGPRPLTPGSYASERHEPQRSAGLEWADKVGYASERHEPQRSAGLEWVDKVGPAVFTVQVQTRSPHGSAPYENRQFEALVSESMLAPSPLDRRPP
jgi:hypothetical protein